MYSNDKDAGRYNFGKMIANVIHGVQVSCYVLRYPGHGCIISYLNLIHVSQVPGDTAREVQRTAE